MWKNIKAYGPKNNNNTEIYNARIVTHTLSVNRRRGHECLSIYGTCKFRNSSSNKAVVARNVNCNLKSEQLNSSDIIFMTKKHSMLIKAASVQTAYSKCPPAGFPH